MSEAFLIVPGLGDSDERHWQSLWEKKFKNFHKVHQQEWTNPYCTDWVNTIEQKVTQLSGKQIFLIAHSLGCIAVAHWAFQTNHKIAGALLVAPPDVGLLQIKNFSKGFAPVPLRRLPFESILVASSNDKYANISKAWQYAKFWNSLFVNVGNKGHINSESGIGDWPEGYNLLNQLVNSKQFSIAY